MILYVDLLALLNKNFGNQRGVMSNKILRIVIWCIWCFYIFSNSFK